MHRAVNYAGAATSVTDVLKTGQFSMEGLAKACEGFIGPVSAADGFTCTPTTPASLNVLLTPGSVYQMQNLEASPISANLVDTHNILKQGILADPATLGITPPGTVGYSQSFLIEVAYQDDDSTTQVLNYYNANNPSSPFFGPPVNGVGSGQAQTTVRKGKCAVQTKAGVAAPTGTQAAPAPDAGWTPLFLVTVANGATTVTSGNITQYKPSPLIDAGAKLPQIPISRQNGKWISADDTSGSPNQILIAPDPAITSYVKYQQFRVKFANTNTSAVVVNVNGVGNKSLVMPNGTPLTGGEVVTNAIGLLTYDGTNFQFTAGAAVAPSGGGGGGGVAVPPYAIFLQMRAHGVFPQTMTLNSYVTRLLNTVLVNTVPSASLNVSTGIMTLPAGTYRTNFVGVTMYGGSNRSRLFDITNNVELATGMTVDSWVSADGFNPIDCPAVPSPGIGRFTLTGTAQVALQHVNYETQPTSYMGDDSQNAAGTFNLYDGQIMLDKEA